MTPCHRRLGRVACAIAFLWAPFTLAAPMGPIRERPVQVFVDCAGCGDLEFVRSEVRFVNYVNDPASADLQVLVARQPAGGGSTAVTLLFLGRGVLAGQDDTLSYIAPGLESDDERRRSLARSFRLGLVRYAVHGPMAHRLNVTETGGPDPSPEGPDRWKGWAFEVGASVGASGESSRSYLSIDWSVAASRVTDLHKFILRGGGGYRENRYRDFGGDGDLVSVYRDHRMSGRLVWNLAPRWSAMGRVEGFTSLYSNVRWQAEVAAGLEYAVLPYDRIWQREFRVSYVAGALAARYQEPTIFDRTREERVTQGVEAVYARYEPWGTASVHADARHFLHDRRLYHVRGAGTMSRRMGRGVVLNLTVSGARIHDQISLPRGVASNEEILLQRRILATQYEYSTSVGLSYTFGTKSPPVVNPRFGRW